jgi:hypothetical protein
MMLIHLLVLTLDALMIVWDTILVIIADGKHNGT